MKQIEQLNNQSPEVTILIPTRFDSKYMLQLCLLSMERHTTVPYKVIIGDSGIDEETKAFLEEFKKARPYISVVECPPPQVWAKDFLARQVDTEFFMFLHDDTQVLKTGWLRRRLDIMKKNPRIGILGPVVANFLYGWRSRVRLSVLDNRFWPLVLLVRTQVQKELDLRWYVVPGLDMGTIAFAQFSRQRKWKYKPFKFHKEVRHWGGMTWVVRKKVDEEKMRGLDKFLERRRQLMERIKQVLRDEYQVEIGDR